MEKKEDPNQSPAEVDDELLQTLERRTNWDGRSLVKWDGFWLPKTLFRPILSTQKHFKAEDSDIILATVPKSGTTWLKALAFSIARRGVYAIDQSPLLTSFTQDVVPFFEFSLYWHQENPDLRHLPSPRIFSTHIPYKILPDSIRESGCRIIYVCRNPLDQFVSSRHFLLANRLPKDAVPLALDEAFDLHCRGVHSFGPFWDHILEYWTARLENPRKVLFLKYEEMKEDIASHVKKMAEFMGCPFSPEEEKRGLVEEISSLCSFDNLSKLEMNSIGHSPDFGIKRSSLFRKGEVGDWVNHLSPAMAERMEKVIESKFEGSGLTFKTYYNKGSC